MTQPFQVIESRRYVHKDGRTASIHGAAPWRSSAEALDWRSEVVGWTVRNPYTGEVGMGRQPFATREEAEAFAARVTPSRIGYGD
jgi:hypothetical protein